MQLHAYYSLTQHLDISRGQILDYRTYTIEADEKAAKEFLKVPRVHKVKQEELTEIIKINDREMTIQQLIEEVKNQRGYDDGSWIYCIQTKQKRRLFRYF